MHGDRHGVAEARPRALLGLPDHRRILAMRDHDQRRLRENRLEGAGVVDEHVPGRGTHEHLDAAGIAGRNLLDLLEIRVRRAEVEAVIRIAAFRGDSLLRRETGSIDARWRVIRHIEIARHAAANRRQRLGRDRSFVRESRLAKMDLIIDEARQHVATGEIDDFGLRVRLSATDPLDPVIDHENIEVSNRSLVDHVPVDEQQLSHPASLFKNLSVAATSSCVMPGS